MSLRTILTLANVTGATESGSGAKQDVSMLSEFAVELVATEQVAGTSLDVKLEDSADGGTTWHDWITFTQLGTTGKEVKAAGRPPLGDVRASYAIVGGTWDVRVKLSGNPTT